jgi:hypothetical protein
VKLRGKKNKETVFQATCKNWREKVEQLLSLGRMKERGVSPSRK